MQLYLRTFTYNLLQMTKEEGDNNDDSRLGGKGGTGGEPQPNEEEEQHEHKISTLSESSNESGELVVDGGGGATGVGIVDAADAGADPSNSDGASSENNDKNSYTGDDEASATAAVAATAAAAAVPTNIIDNYDVIDDSGKEDDKSNFNHDNVVGIKQSESDEEFLKNASSRSSNQQAQSQMAIAVEGGSWGKELYDQPQAQEQEDKEVIINKVHGGEDQSDENITCINDPSIFCSLLSPLLPSPSSSPLPSPSQVDHNLLQPMTMPKPSPEPPNLYDETKEMMEIATMMFFISKMRNLARAEKLYVNDKKPDTEKGGNRKKEKKKEGVVYSKKQDILGDKVTIRNVIDTIHDCSDKITEIEGFLPDGTPRTKFNVELMESIRSRVGGDDERFFEINHFDDIREYEEIVPAIVVDHHRRMIIVSFRGSESKNDWVVNFSFAQVWVKNPVRAMLEKISTEELQKTLGGKPIACKMRVRRQSKKLNLHTGFYNSIFHESSHFGIGNKYNDIMKKVLAQLERNPGYNLGVTGFSLGGALCQVFALHVASEMNPLIPKPVTCFSYATPKVGSVTYRRAIQSLEELGMLRLFRVLNDNDYVTVLPRDPISTFGYSCLPLIPLNILCRQGRFYRKAGLELKLIEDEGIALSHPKMPGGVNWGLYVNLLRYDIGGTWKRQKQCWGCAYKVLTFDREITDWRDAHSYIIYYDKINNRRRAIEKYTLENLYVSSIERRSDLVRQVFS